MIINLTMHNASPEQLEQGLVNVADQDLLKALLDIPNDALEASDYALDGFLQHRAWEIYQRFVMPLQLERLNQLLETTTRVVWSCDAKAYGAVVDFHFLNGLEEAKAVQCLVGGAPILVERLIQLLKEQGAVPLYSLSPRVSTEQTLPDGTTRKVAIHRHLRFRKAM